MNEFGSTSEKKRAMSFRDDKEAVKKMKELSKTFYDKSNIPAIPNKYRGLTDSKKD